EGGLVVAAIGLVLVGCQVSRTRRMPVRQFLACASCLGIATLVIAGPYVAVIGGGTNQNSVKHGMTNERVESAPRGAATLPLAVWWPGEPNAARGWWGLWALGTELSRGALHVGWVLALIGLWAYRDRLRTTPGTWVLLVLCGVTAVVLWLLA